MDKILTYLRETVGRKLASVILGPILISMISAVNALLPASVQWTADQVTTIATWILGTVVAFITAQGWVDKKKAEQPTTTSSVQTVSNVVKPAADYDPTANM